MGNSFVGRHYVASYTEPETTPKWSTKPTFDPQIGFDGKRQERVMPVTMEEMNAIGMTEENKGFCANYLIKYMTCMQDNRPWYTNCHGMKHDWHHCLDKEHELRMKEYEREWRLRKRADRIAKARAATAADAAEGDESS